MKFRLFFLLVVLMAASCKPFPRDHYEHERLSFKISDDFFIRRPVSSKRNDGTYIKVVNKDLKLFATITVAWFPGERDLDKTLEDFKRSLSETYSDPKFDAAFGLPLDGEFASRKTRRVNYFVNNDPRKGSYQAFVCEGLTVIIGEHYFAESEAAVKRCLKTIGETITCR